MRKFLKAFLVINILVISCLCLGACDKDAIDELEDGIDDLDFDITIEATTEATTELITTEITTEATTEEVKEERPSYIVTDSVDTSSIVESAVEGSETNPAKQGEWTQALKTIGSDEPRQTLYFRTTDVARGEEAMAILKEYETSDGFYKFDDLGYDDLEYCVMTYQVYFPEGYFEEDWGITFTNLSFHVVDGDNAGTINNYIGMAQTYDISEYVKNKTLYAGDVLERQVVFVMVKDYTDYMLYYRYYDDDYNEFTKYVACEKLPDGAASSDTNTNSGTGTSPSVNSSNTTETTTETSGNASDCTIKNDVYYVVGVEYDDGRYATKEQLEQNSGQSFEVVFMVFDGTCIFDASGAGDGLGRSAGPITQTSDTEFYFVDSGGNTFNGTYDASENTIRIDMGSTTMVFVAD